MSFRESYRCLSNLRDIADAIVRESASSSNSTCGDAIDFCIVTIGQSDFAAIALSLGMLSQSCCCEEVSETTVALEALVLVDWRLEVSDEGGP